jgi:plasmid stabilization system protein ParE
MSARFQFTPQAVDDIDSIWWFIAKDSQGAADRVETEIIQACRRLAKHPGMGMKRHNITKLPLRFWTITKFPNYVIVYRPETAPLQIVAVLHAKRNLKRHLKARL